MKIHVSQSHSKEQQVFTYEKCFQNRPHELDALFWHRFILKFQINNVAVAHSSIKFRFSLIYFRLIIESHDIWRAPGWKHCNGTLSGILAYNQIFIAINETLQNPIDWFIFFFFFNSDLTSGLSIEKCIKPITFFLSSFPSNKLSIYI